MNKIHHISIKILNKMDSDIFSLKYILINLYTNILYMFKLSKTYIFKLAR